MKTGIELIAEERQRQIEIERWTPEYDDVANNDGQLGNAAACYAMTEETRLNQTFDEVYLDAIWPFEQRWFKPTPKDRIRELQKAGALIAAEIDRLNRQSLKNKKY